METLSALLSLCEGIPPNNNGTAIVQKNIVLFSVIVWAYSLYHEINKQAHGPTQKAKIIIWIYSIQGIIFLLLLVILASRATLFLSRLTFYPGVDIIGNISKIIYLYITAIIRSAEIGQYF